jgi:hypothetical protein
VRADLSRRSFLNLNPTPTSLVIAWALAVFAIVALPGARTVGRAGSAPCFFAAILKALLDPNTAPLRALPREDRDLFIAASNGHVLAFDNVSGLPAWISDTLCRLATGGGFAVRQLYTDQDEVLFDATRPVILNGIEDIVTRPDLADRAVFLTLEPIPENRRRPEAIHQLVRRQTAEGQVAILQRRQQLHDGSARQIASRTHVQLAIRLAMDDAPDPATGAVASGMT